MATGGPSDRQDRLDKRNMDKEIGKIREQRKIFIDHIRKSANLGQSSDPESIERTTDDRMRQESKVFQTLDSSLTGLRRKISYLDSTRAKTPGRVSVANSVHGDGTASITKPNTGAVRKEITDNSKVDGEIAELSRKLRDMEQSIVENEMKYRESALEKRLSEIEERERKDQEELEMMKCILHQRELEISNREVDLREKETYLEEKIAQSEKDMKGYELRLNDMERTMLEKFDVMDKNMKVREIEYNRKEAEVKRREETLEVKENEVSGHGQIIDDIDRQIQELVARKEVLGTTAEAERHEQEGTGSRVHTSLPRMNDNLNIKLNLTQYSGTEPRPKNEATFEEWKMEVQNVQASYQEIVIMQAVRRSLRGQAKRIMLHLGPTAMVNDVVQKLEDAFGNIASRDCILSHFFMAEQEVDETVVEWGLRLEEMLLQASRKATLTEFEKQEMLRKRFWRGLRNDQLRDATRVHFEGGVSFEVLRNKVRSEEFEIKIAKERSGSKQRQGTAQKSRIFTQDVTTDSDNILKELINKIESLDRKVDELQQGKTNEYQDHNQGQSRGRRPYRGGYTRRRGRGNTQRDRPPERHGQEAENENTLDSLNR